MVKIYEALRLGNKPKTRFKTGQLILCLGLLFFLLFSSLSYGQATYTWTGNTNNNWATSTNWSPNRTSTNTNDRLIFNSGTTVSITISASQTIGRLTITNNTRLNLNNTATSNVNLSITNGVGTDLMVDSGSTLQLSGTSNRLRINIGANSSSNVGSAQIDGELILATNGNINLPGTNLGNTLVVNGKITNLNGSINGANLGEISFSPNSEYHHARTTSSGIPTATWNTGSLLRLNGPATGLGQNFANVRFEIIPNSSFNFNPISISGDLTIANTGPGRINTSRNAYTIAGNLNLISGNFAVGNGSNRNITILGDYIQSGGTNLLSASNSISGTLTINGDFIHTGGTITETASGFGLINFAGAGPTQTFTSGGTVSNQINWNIAANSFVQTSSASTTFGGNGNFTINSGATLGIRATDGIATSGATGHVRSTGTRTFNANANYIFNGSSNQTSNSNFPASANTIRIENTGSSGNNTISLERNVAIGGNLLINQGNLDLASFTLDRGSAGGTFSLGAGLKLNVGGTDNFPKNYSTYTIPCTSIVEYDGDLDQTIGGVNYGVLTIGGSDTKTFTSETTTICGNLTFQGSSSSIASNGISVGGNVLIDAGSSWTPGAYTHQVAGNWIRLGTFNAVGSTIDFNGSSAASIGTSNFEHVIFSGTGAKTALGAITFTGNVSIPGNFTSGAYTHAVGGNWSKTGTFNAAGSTINFNGANPGNIGASNFNNLTFSGAGVKTATGILNASGNISITNNFSAGSFGHTIGGNWTSSAGSFTPGTSLITFNGTTAQTISATGNSFYDLSLNNSTGLSASSALTLTRFLTIDAGTFATAGNLTMGEGSSIIRKGTGTSTGMTGTIAGSNNYDVRYEGGSKNTGSEISGTGLRDVNLALNASSTLTAAGNVSLSGLLTIPAGITLDMSTFPLTKPGLSTSGTGTLSTRNTSLNPIPAGLSWSFLVRYANPTGSQKVVFGTYAGLVVAGTSGTVTLAQASEGNITIGSGNFTTTAGQTYTVTGSTVVFNAAAAQTLPGITFNNVSLAGSGDKTLSTNSQIQGIFSISGTAVAKLGNTNRSVGSLLLNNVIQSTGSYGSTASAATNQISQFFGTTGTGVINVTSLCIDGEWLGTTSSNWFEPTNWCGGVPTNTTDVTIPATAPNQPSIGANGAVTRSIQIQTGATLTVSGAFTLTVNGNWTNAGTFNAGTSTVNFAGSTDALIGASNFRNIILSGTGVKSLTGATIITGNLSISSGATLEGGTFTHSLAGNFANAGSFLAESSTFLFNAGPSTISGAAAKNFYNIQVTNGATLTVTNATEVSNSLFLTSGTVAAGSNLTMAANSRIQRAGTALLPTTFTGTLQGANAYDVTYSGENKTAGSELSGTGLRNITLSLSSGNIITAASTITHTGVLTIPTGNTLAMSSFALANPNLTTSGTGTLTTQSTSTTPLPAGKTWSFLVNYSRTAGGQKIVWGSYNGLTASNTSGTNTLAPLTDGGEITIASGNFSAAGTYTSTGSTVRFSAAGAQSVPGITYNNLILDGSGDKTFAATSSTSGSLTIASGVIARLLNVNHTANSLILGTTGQPNGTFGSSVSGAAFKISSSFGATDTGILTVASSNCTTGLWLGYVSTDWNDAGNWCGAVPTATTDVIISSSAPNQPIIGSAGAIARNITIQAGATLAFSGAFDLQVFGNWINNGTFTPSQGRVTFKGTGNQSFGGSSNTSIYRLILEKASDDQVILNSNLTLTNSLLLTSGTLTASTRLSVVANTQITRGGTTGASTAFTGTIQGATAYDVTYTGNSKNTGAELTGTGLRNITLNVVSANEITATSNITHSAQLAIPAGMSLNMSTYALNNTTTSSGTGTLKTASTVNPAIPRGRTWSFAVNYTAPTGNQRVSYGIYNSLSIGNTSGTTTLDPFSAGGEIEISSGNLTKASGTVSGSGSTVNFSASATQAIPVITYGDLILQGSGDKTFSGATTISGTLTIDGTAIAKLGSSVTHTAASLILGTAGQPNGSFGSSASGATFKVPQYFGATGTGILNVTTSTCTPGIWLGYVSSNYNSGQNWCGGSVPNATTDVVIPAGTPFSPVISTGSNYNVQSMTIESGATLAIQGTQTITIGGDWTNDGTFLPGTASTVIFNNSDEDQLISGSGANNFYSIRVDKANSTLSIDDPSTIAGKLSLLDGPLDSNGNITLGANSSIERTDGTFAGTIQGNNTYDLTYLGGNKTTGGETSGAGLRNMTLALGTTNVLTAGAVISMSGQLTIPATQTLQMGNNALSGNLTTSGTGLLTTTNSSASPLPGARTWTFAVSYLRASGGQKVVYGVYHELTIGNTSGTTTFAPQTEGTVEIASGNLTLASGGTQNASAAKLRFSSPSAQTIPALTYRNLELLGGGDKIFAGVIAVSEDLSIGGSAVAKLLNVNHTANTVTLGGANQPAGTYGSTASAAQYKISHYFGTTGTGILTVATGTCVPGTWFGVTSTDWNDGTNWCGGIPSLTTDVIIPSGTPFSPVIGIAGGLSRNLTIQSGATLSISDAYLLQVTGNWNNSGTFNPGANSTVDFNGATSGTISAGNFANLSFTGSGTKTINATLSVTGNISPISSPVILNNPFSLTLPATKTMEILASGSFTTTGASSKIILPAGAIYVNRSSSNPRLESRQTFTGTKGWRAVGVPIGSTYATMTAGFETQGFPGSTNPSLQPNLLWWDETDKGTTLQGYRQPSGISDAVPAGRGHYFYIFDGASKPSPATGNYTDALPITMSITGSEANLASGIFDFQVTFTPRDTNLLAQSDTLIEVNQADEGFNLIANPTASTLDWDAVSGWTKTNLDQSIYVWDPASEAFLVWNGSVGNLGNGFIAPYQGFWVHANAASPSLTLGNEAKILSSSSFFGRKLETPTPTIHLRIAGENLSAESFISFGEDGKAETDPKDAFQLESLAEDWLLLYTFGSLKTQTPLVINHQAPLDEQEKVIPLHLAASKNGAAVNGSYLLDWTLPADLPSNVTVILMDHISQKAINMREESAHTFSFEAPKQPNARSGKFQNPLDLPKAILFESPYAIGAVNPTARTVANKPQRPFTLFISSKTGDEIGYLPDLPKLFSPVPNPFQSATKIRFYLPETQQAEVQILDMFGQVVGSFPGKIYKAGISEVEWIPAAIDLPAGMYIIRLSTKEYQVSQKLIKN